MARARTALLTRDKRITSPQMGSSCSRRVRVQLRHPRRQQPDHLSAPDPALDNLKTSLNPKLGCDIRDLDNAHLANRISTNHRRQVIWCPPKPDVLSQLHLMTAANSDLARVVARNHDYMSGITVLPLAFPDAAAAELERSVTQLGCVGALVENKSHRTGRNTTARSIAYSGRTQRPGSWACPFTYTSTVPATALRPTTTNLSHSPPSRWDTDSWPGGLAPGRRPAPVSAVLGQVVSDIPPAEHLSGSYEEEGPSISRSD